MGVEQEVLELIMRVKGQAEGQALEAQLERNQRRTQGLRDDLDALNQEYTAGAIDQAAYIAAKDRVEEAIDREVKAHDRIVNGLRKEEEANKKAAQATIDAAAKKKAAAEAAAKKEADDEARKQKAIQDSRSKDARDLIEQLERRRKANEAALQKEIAADLAAEEKKRREDEETANRARAAKDKEVEDEIRKELEFLRRRTELRRQGQREAAAEAAAVRERMAVMGDKFEPGVDISSKVDFSKIGKGMDGPQGPAGKFGKLQQNITGLSYAMNDFFSVQGGIDQRLGAVANNLPMLLSGFGNLGLILSGVTPIVGMVIRNFDSLKESMGFAVDKGLSGIALLEEELDKLEKKEVKVPVDLMAMDSLRKQIKEIRDAIEAVNQLSRTRTYYEKESGQRVREVFEKAKDDEGKAVGGDVVAGKLRGPVARRMIEDPTGIVGRARDEVKKVEQQIADNRDMARHVTDASEAFAMNVLAGKLEEKLEAAIQGVQMAITSITTAKDEKTPALADIELGKILKEAQEGSGDAQKAAQKRLSEMLGKVGFAGMGVDVAEAAPERVKETEEEEKAKRDQEEFEDELRRGKEAQDKMAIDRMKRSGRLEKIGLEIAAPAAAEGEEKRLNPQEMYDMVYPRMRDAIKKELDKMGRVDVDVKTIATLAEQATEQAVSGASGKVKQAEQATATAIQQADSRQKEVKAQMETGLGDPFIAQIQAAILRLRTTPMRPEVRNQRLLDLGASIPKLVEAKLVESGRTPQEAATLALDSVKFIQEDLEKQLRQVQAVANTRRPAPGSMRAQGRRAGMDELAISMRELLAQFQQAVPEANLPVPIVAQAPRPEARPREVKPAIVQPKPMLAEFPSAPRPFEPPNPFVVPTAPGPLSAPAPTVVQEPPKPPAPVEVAAGEVTVRTPGTVDVAPPEIRQGKPNVPAQPAVNVPPPPVSTADATAPPATVTPSVPDVRAVPPANVPAPLATTTPAQVTPQVNINPFDVPSVPTVNVPAPTVATTPAQVNPRINIGETVTPDVPGATLPPPTVATTPAEVVPKVDVKPAETIGDVAASIDAELARVNTELARVRRERGDGAVADVTPRVDVKPTEVGAVPAADVPAPTVTTTPAQVNPRINIGETVIPDVPTADVPAPTVNTRPAEVTPKVDVKPTEVGAVPDVRVGAPNVATTDATSKPNINIDKPDIPKHEDVTVDAPDVATETPEVPRTEIEVPAPLVTRQPAVFDDTPDASMVAEREAEGRKEEERMRRERDAERANQRNIKRRNVRSRVAANPLDTAETVLASGAETPPPQRPAPPPPRPVDPEVIAQATEARLRYLETVRVRNEAERGRQEVMASIQGEQNVDIANPVPARTPPPPANVADAAAEKARKSEQQKRTIELAREADTRRKAEAAKRQQDALEAGQALARAVREDAAVMAGLDVAEPPAKPQDAAKPVPADRPKMADVEDEEDEPTRPPSTSYFPDALADEQWQKARKDAIERARRRGDDARKSAETDARTRKEQETRRDNIVRSNLEGLRGMDETRGEDRRRPAATAAETGAAPIDVTGTAGAPAAPMASELKPPPFLIYNQRSTTPERPAARTMPGQPQSADYRAMSSPPGPGPDRSTSPRATPATTQGPAPAMPGRQPPDNGVVDVVGRSMGVVGGTQQAMADTQNSVAALQARVDMLTAGYGRLIENAGRLNRAATERQPTALNTRGGYS